ncbi:MAG: glycosyltransferase, partial [Patescibacteria group bacterium]
MSTRQVKSRLSIRLAAQEPRVKAIYVGTYIPRECGIATFTKDLTNAVNLLNPTYLADIIAIDDIAVASESEPKRSYPWEVKFKINQEDLASWLAAADYINQSSAQIVNLQHEFGIYGGQRGEYVLPFMERIRKPIVITLHTVMPDPDIVLQEMVGRMAKLASAVVVMVETAAHRLVEKYQIDPEKIVVIPHGVPDVPLIDPDSRKKRFRLFGQNVITSFGL